MKNDLAALIPCFLPSDRGAVLTQTAEETHKGVGKLVLSVLYARLDVLKINLAFDTSRFYLFKVCCSL